ncbi:MAG: response regulator transcription factor [Synechococcaceae cyanobacterium]|nr:response regulator transcription factor [Synechococcaceae cyanobacterium]
MRKSHRDDLLPDRCNPRCLLVDDQAMFLELLVAMLRSQGLVDVAGACGSVSEAKLLCQELRPDLLILDLALPDGSGTEILDTLRQVSPAARVIILSAEASGFMCPVSLRDQVEAVIDKSRAYADLNQAVAALRRRCFGGEHHQPLTAREDEVLSLIAGGFSNQEIATALHLSRHTVETHRKRIVAKLGIRSQDLVRHAAQRAQASS